MRTSLPDLSPEDLIFLTIYGLMGQVMHAAHAVELAVSSVLIIDDAKRDQFETGSDFDRRFQTYLRLPMGDKVKRARRLLPKEVGVQLNKATRDRNRIAHWYGVELMTKLDTPAGQQSVVDDLSAMSDRLHALVDQLSSLARAEVAGVQGASAVQAASTIPEIKASEYLILMVAESKKRRRV